MSHKVLISRMRSYRGPEVESLDEYFAQAGDRYTISPRVVVSYIEVSALKYLDQVKVTEEEARKFYDENPSRFPKPADANKPPAALTPKVTPPADPAADFAAVRPQVESALKFEKAKKLAAKEK